MAQRPAVVFIARHGPRLDAADQSWHLSTPTPYDPPLTYAGWNQSRALGVRIAALLHARKKALDTDDVRHSHAPHVSARGVATRDFAQGGERGKEKRNGAHDEDGGPRKRRKKQKVVIHTSPFLRCVQTSVGIAAGMAQYQPTSVEDITTSRSISAARPRTPATLHSASPRLRGVDSGLLPGLAPIPEPRQNLTHVVARKAHDPSPRRGKVKLRVDAFLGEWLNPQYFDHITPPPPSAMMVASAKGAMISQEQVESYTPTNTHHSSRNTTSSLWGGGRHQRNTSKSSVEDMSALDHALPSHAVPPKSRRDRTSSFNGTGSSDGKLSALRSHHHTQPLPSMVEPEPVTYQAPVPQYAVSGSDRIPRGYVGHARQACVNVDYQWDSSRAPQSWGDGGDYGEEWSSMHKRFRRGLNHLVQWYAQHNADDRAEDALGLDQAEHHEPEDREEEELVMILVTHGAGCNALIGALTAQPVLLDVGMASLTMAVHKQDAPPLTHSQAHLQTTSGHARRNTIDMGLSAVYDMKLVASSDHLRVGVDPARAPTLNPTVPRRLSHVRDTLPRLRPGSHSSAESIEADDWHDYNQPGRATNSALGSILRPSLLATSAATMSIRDNPSSASDAANSSTPLYAPGLWSPVASRAPSMPAQSVEKSNDHTPLIAKEPQNGLANHDQMHDFSASPLAIHPPSADFQCTATAIDLQPSSTSVKQQGQAPGNHIEGLSDPPTAVEGNLVDGTSEARHHVAPTRSTQQYERQDSVDMPKPESDVVPTSLSRGLSQKGLWGSKPRGARVERNFNLAEPKRRWTLLDS